MKLIILLQVVGEVAVHVESQNLTSLCNLMVFCLATASIAHFLDKCMEKGMIFRRYYNWITYWLWLSKKSIIVEEYKPTSPLQSLVRKSFEEQVEGNRCNDKHCNETGIANNRNFIYQSPVNTIKIKFLNNPFRWLWKVMGGCIYCSSFYQFVGLYGFTMLLIPGLLVDWFIVLGIGFNYLFIEVIQNIKMYGKRL